MERYVEGVDIMSKAYIEMNRMRREHSDKIESVFCECAKLGKIDVLKEILSWTQHKEKILKNSKTKELAVKLAASRAQYHTLLFLSENKFPIMPSAVTEAMKYFRTNTNKNKESYYEKTIHFLLSQGTSWFNIQNEYFEPEGYICLPYIIQSNNIALFSLIISLGADVSKCLKEALFQKNKSATMYFITQGADLNYKYRTSFGFGGRDYKLIDEINDTFPELIGNIKFGEINKQNISDTICSNILKEEELKMYLNHKDAHKFQEEFDYALKKALLNSYYWSVKLILESGVPLSSDLKRTAIETLSNVITICDCNDRAYLGVIRNSTCTGCLSQSNYFTYIGQRNGQYPEGSGKIYRNKSLAFEGEWRCGKREGFGVIWNYLQKRSSCLYKGYWMNDVFHGHGEYKYALRDRGRLYEWNYIHGNYIGQFHNGKPHGQGTQKYKYDVEEYNVNSYYICENQGQFYDGEFLSGVVRKYKSVGLKLELISETSK